MRYSFALLPWVFIPFAHQTAAIIRARQADLATVEGSYRARLPPRLCVLIGSYVIAVVTYWSTSQQYRRSSLIDVVGLVVIRNVLYVYLPEKLTKSEFPVPIQNVCYMDLFFFNYISAFERVHYLGNVFHNSGITSRVLESNQQITEMSTVFCFLFSTMFAILVPLKLFFLSKLGK